MAGFADADSQALVIRCWLCLHQIVSQAEGREDSELGSQLSNEVCYDSHRFNKLTMYRVKSIIVGSATYNIACPEPSGVKCLLILVLFCIHLLMKTFCVEGWCGKFHTMGVP